MLDIETFNKFIGKANQTHQQFCIWFSANNEFVKHQVRWNEEGAAKKGDCRYKNFWSVVIPSLQHCWVLGTARLLDPAYFLGDKKKINPRLSLDFILEQLNDEKFISTIKKEQIRFESFIESIRVPRKNFHAHNDLNYSNYSNNIINPGVEDLYEWLESVISRIKILQPHLNSCNTINLKYNEDLAQLGVGEVFDDLLKAEES